MRKIATLLLLFLVILTCSIQRPVIRDASLFPLYLHTPQASSDPLLFAALRMRIERGSTDIRRIRIEHKTQDIFWDIDLKDEDIDLLRVPRQQSEDFVQPFFANPNSGELYEFFYPWFLSPDANEIPDGAYTLTIWDYAGESLSTTVLFENLSENELNLLSLHLSRLNPFSPDVYGSYETINLPNGRYPDIEFRIGHFEFYSRSQNRDDLNNTLLIQNLFLWGTPNGIPCLVLSGPY